MSKTPLSEEQSPVVMDSNSLEKTVEIPSDAVALVIWRNSTNPMTVIVTKESWERNSGIVRRHGRLMPENVYEFESPVDLKGRKSIFQFQGVTSWIGNIYVGNLLPAPETE